MTKNMSKSEMKRRNVLEGKPMNEGIDALKDHFHPETDGLALVEHYKLKVKKLEEELSELRQLYYEVIGQRNNLYSSNARYRNTLKEMYRAPTDVKRMVEMAKEALGDL